MKYEKYIFIIIIVLMILVGMGYIVIHNDMQRNQLDYAEVKNQSNFMSKDSEDGRINESQMDKETIWSDTDEMIEDCVYSYDHWTEFLDEKSIPYVDEKTFQLIRVWYAEINFYGEFKKGNMDVYDLFKHKFKSWILNEESISDRSSEEFLVKDSNCRFEQYEYYIFDMDEDGLPELSVQSDTFIWILKYDEKADECFVWKSLNGTWYSLIGSRKVMWLWDGKYWHYEQYDQNGEVECETFLMRKFADTPCLVMVPKYTDEEKEIEITKEMKAQGVFERGSGRWYFRVTEEQYNELIEDCVDAEYVALKRREEVSYTYEEILEF